MKSFFAIKIMMTCCALAFLFSACEDGEDGLNGNNAEQYDELTKYGSVTLTFSGKTGDDAAILDTVAFPYALSPAFSTMMTDGESTTFNVSRLETMEDGVDGDLTPNFYLFAHSSGSNKPDFAVFRLYTRIITANNQHILLPFADGGIEIPSSGISNYSYDAASGKLKFNFTVTIPAEENYTTNDLAITGVVDVIVFEEY